ncbi:ArsR/SmtB family transcription factor [Halorarum halobium]|uniref:ArsR/SmtB family transcription factor n=1 Tax=Halorarum halobium TaxID=3075121 RepID=UPI0028AA5541|nr:winged helix-turn-helix domain-containing protein [Halobaculum sp. XH14]
MSGLLPSDVDTPSGDSTATETVPGSDAGRQESPEEVTDEDGDVRVCWLDDDDADALIGSLSSETARSLLTALHDEPRTASKLAETADTSVQNVRHHLENLQEAGLVTTAGTRYSVKGREMTIYRPTNERLVVAVGGDEDRTSFLDSLRGLLGVLALLGGASLLVQWAFGGGVADLGGPETAPRIGDAVGGSAEVALGVLPPGVAFLAGGLLVLAAVLAVGHLRSQ